MSSLKPAILALIRSLGLSRSLDNARYAYFRMRMRNANRSFLREHPEVHLPPDYLMYESFRLDYRLYWEDGKETARWVLQQLSAVGWSGHAQVSILDWGCGPGRVTRHLKALLPAGSQVHGADPNTESIQWCAGNLGEFAEFRTCQPEPPLPYPENSMDVLFGLSILTHLSEDRHRSWWQEIRRVCKPGALVLLTTHGKACMVNLTGREQDDFRKGVLVVRSKTAEGHRTFTAYHPPVYMRNLFGDGGEILLHQEGRQEPWGISQDSWLVRVC